MKIKLNDRKWLNGVVQQKASVDTVQIDSKPIIENEIKAIVNRLEKMESKKDRRIIANIIRDTQGKMTSIIIESENK